MPVDAPSVTRLPRPLLAIFALLLAVLPVGADGPGAPAPSPEPPSNSSALPATAQSQLRETLNGRADPPGPGQIMVATEILFVVNSYLASIAPRIYGGAGIVLLPAGLSGMDPGPERTTSFVLVEGIALYNLLGVNTDKMSERDIFRTNFAAWHGILLVNALVHHTVEKRSGDRKKIVIVPLRKGAAVQTAWKF